MKKRIVLDAPIDQLFDAFISPTLEAYTQSKKRRSTQAWPVISSTRTWSKTNKICYCQSIKI